MEQIRPWWGGEKPPNPRHAERILHQAAELEAALWHGGGPLDRRLADYRSGRPKMGGNDRAVLSAALYGLARSRDLARAALPELAHGGGDLLLVALYDSIAGGIELAPGPVRERVARLREFRGALVAKVEAAWAERLPDSSAIESLALLFSLPPSVLPVGPWRTVGEAAAELNAGRFPQLPQLRVGVSRTSREEVLARLAAKAIHAKPTELSPWGVVLGSRVQSGALADLPVEFQDEGSQLAALACLPLPKEARALDYCAGAGGKGLAIAEAAGCSVHLHDSDRRRLDAAVPRIRLAGLETVSLTANPSRDAPYDLVLVDAPCTSTGTMRRNPEIGWKWTPKEVAGFAKTQLEILSKASRLVKPSGLLVYSTCSLLDAENFGVASAFLRSNRDFAPEPPPDGGFGQASGAKAGVFRLPMNLPGYSGDGFFIARLRKKE